MATLLHAVPVHLGSAHQAGALTLFSLVLFALHSCRVPHAGRMAARLLPARGLGGRGLAVATVPVPPATPLFPARGLPVHTEGSVSQI